MGTKTLRDEIAIEAMKIIMAQEPKIPSDALARWSYEVANAMMAAAKAEGGENDADKPANDNGLKILSVGTKLCDEHANGWPEKIVVLDEKRNWSMNYVPVHLLRLECQKGPPSQSVWPENPHNPDKLTDEQIGVGNGWRLLDEKEIYQGAVDTYISNVEMWDVTGWIDFCRANSFDATYRTKLTRAEFISARAKQLDERWNKC